MEVQFGNEGGRLSVRLTLANEGWSNGIEPRLRDYGWPFGITRVERINFRTVEIVFDTPAHRQEESKLTATLDQFGEEVRQAELRLMHRRASVPCRYPTR